MSLIQRIPWRQQPQTPQKPAVVIASLGQIDCLWSAGIPLYNHAKQKLAVVNGNGTYGVGPYGRVFVGDGVGDSLEFNGAYAGAGADYTLACIIKSNDVGTSRTLISTSATGTSGIYLMHSAASGQWSFSKPGGAGDLPSGVAATTDWWFISASYINATGFIQFVLKNLSTNTLYATTASNTGSFTIGDGNFGVGGARFYPNNMLNGQIAFAFGARFALPLCQLLDLSANPWQLFSPLPRRIWGASGCGRRRIHTHSRSRLLCASRKSCRSSQNADFVGSSWVVFADRQHGISHKRPGTFSKCGKLHRHRQIGINCSQPSSIGKRRKLCLHRQIRDNRLCPGN
jgi:hypothetical protein